MTAVRTTSAHSVRRRSASNRVSRTIVGTCSRARHREAASPPSEAEEPLLERGPPRLDRMDPAARGDDRRDQLGDLVRRRSGRIASQSPSSVSGPNRPRAARAAGSSPVTRSAYGVLAEQLLERARRDDPAGIDDRDPVAHELDLGQQVRVEEDGHAAVAGLADDPTDVGPADRVEGRRRLVEQDEVGSAEERRPRGRAAAASPSRTWRRGRPPGRSRPTVSSAASISAGARRRGDPRQRAVEREHLAGAQPRLVAEELGQVADPPPRGIDRRAAPRAGSPARTVAAASPTKSLTEVVLPAPFGPRKPNTSPRLDPHRQAGQGGRPAVALHQVERLDRRLHR